MKFINYKTLLNTCSHAMLKKYIFFLLASSMVSSNLSAQLYKITGHVLNEQNEPVPNVNITLKRTGHIFTSNDKGDFEIKGLASDTLLTFSSVGYETLEYTLEKITSPLFIHLKRAAQELNEVEVVSSGYQDIPKERATGSFVKIDNDALNQQTGTNILKRLEGVTSGLLFEIGKKNSNSQNKLGISIRGLSTINGPLDPLVVLDGFIYEGDIDNINPGNIDNVTILKDAAATSIWGARAGNGVIVITTKKGKYNQGLQVNVSANMSLGNKADLLSLPYMNSDDYIEVEQLLFNKGYFDAQIYGNPYSARTGAVDVFLRRKNGEISSADSALEIGSLKKIDSRKEYLKYFYRSPVTQQYALDLRGGTDKNMYSFSIGYDNTIGDNYNKSDKINIHIDNSYMATKNLQVTIGAYYTAGSSSSGRNLSYNTITTGGRATPYIRFTDDNGDPVSIATSLNDTYTDTAGAGKLLDWKYYPLEDYKHYKSTSALQELFAYTGLQYKINKFVELDLKYQYQKQQTETDLISDIDSYSSRYLINEFSQLNRNTGNVTYIVPLGGKKNISTSLVQSQTFRGQLNIHPSWGHHEINAIAGAEARQAYSFGNNFSIFGYNVDPLTYKNVDFVNDYPDFITGSYSKIDGAPRVFSGMYNRFVSLYGNASYAYKRKYIASASVRKDGSNVFGLNTNDRWKPLWSVGGKWKISKEDFYHSSLIPVMALRITYGYSGNVDLSKTAELVGSYFSGARITGLPFTLIRFLNNPELRWEQTGIFNVGIDFSTKNNIVSGSVEYYSKKGIDLYGATPYDYTTWGGSPVITKNVANMKGKGIDLSLNSKNSNRQVKWTSDFILSFNQSKTTKYFSNESKNIISLVGGGSNITPVVGKPLYAVAAYKWGGLSANGDPQGYLNGQLSTDYQSIVSELSSKGPDGIIKYIGSANPTFFGALNNTISWKGISFSANITYKLGYYFWKSSVSSYAGIMSSGTGQKEYSKRWQKPGDEKITNVPAFIYPINENRDGFYSLSEINVSRADNIRLQYINLSYSLNAPKRKSGKVNAFTLYANLSNLGIIWKSNKEGLDPDYPGTLAPSRRYSFGIRAKF